MAENFDYDVFISYSSKDEGTVHALAERLRDSGLRVWLDGWVIRPGDPISLRIQHGLEKSRVLLMCMSKAYFASDWAGLEHHSLLFRDPANRERRFIPVLIENCERPYTVAQFAYVDWREPSGEAYDKLLAACRPDQAEEPAGAAAPATGSTAVNTLEGHGHTILAVAVTPDGRRAVSGSVDRTLKVWDLEAGRLEATLQGHGGAVWAVAVTPDGRRAVSGSDDRTLKVWDLEAGRLEATLEGHGAPVLAVAVTPDGQRAVSGSHDRTLKVWDLEAGRLEATLEGQGGPVFAVAVTPDGRRAVSGSADRTLKVWDLEAGRLEATLEGHGDWVLAVAVTPDGRRAVSGSADRTLKVWDLEAGRLEATLEGHGDTVRAVAVTPDGRRAVSGSADGTLKVWDLEAGRLEATLEGHGDTVRAVAVTPDGRRAVSGSADGTLKVWDLPPADVAVGAEETTRYTNAKVALVGESGVGKTGLAIRLAEGVWRETSSTHGMNVWPLDLPPRAAADDVDMEREVWLWDFAGQPDYRLINQLYMDETALALMVFDPQKERPFEPLGHWEKALTRAMKHDPAKLLVAARCDRGGVMISRRAVDDYWKAHGYEGYLPTAAKSDDRCDELKSLIAEHVPWARLPWTATTRLFKALKESILRIKDDGIVLTRIAELRQRLELERGEPVENGALRAVVGLLAGQGIVQKLEFGDWVLLQPEQINNYASAVVRAARESPSELAEIPERDVLDARIDFKDMPRLDAADELILLRAMVQTFLDRSLCARVETVEGTKLVFPAYFRHDRPEIAEHPNVVVTYGFAGPVDEIYTTLVVRLHYTNEFEIERLWRYAGDFAPFCGGRAGLLLTRSEDDAAELKAYFDAGVTDDTKVLFIKYVHEHLKRHAQDVTRVRSYVCPHCNTPLENRKAIAKRLELRKRDIICGVCEERVLLIDLLEDKFASDDFLNNVRRMDDEAQIRLDNESLELILVGHAYSTVGEAGHIFRQTANSDWGIDGEIEFKNDEGKASGNRLYLQLKSGDSYLHQRKSDGKEVFRIKNPRHAEYWQAHEYPVMLVIRTSDGQIRWMNVTDYLKKHGSATKQIEFEGEPFTAINVVRKAPSFQVAREM